MNGVLRNNICMYGIKIFAMQSFQARGEADKVSSLLGLAPRRCDWPDCGLVPGEVACESPARRRTPLQVISRWSHGGDGEEEQRCWWCRAVAGWLLVSPSNHSIDRSKCQMAFERRVLDWDGAVVIIGNRWMCVVSYKLYGVWRLADRLRTAKQAIINRKQHKAPPGETKPVAVELGWKTTPPPPREWLHMKSGCWLLVGSAGSKKAAAASTPQAAHGKTAPSRQVIDQQADPL
ncbi:uncharacterized protein CIMG_03269 [Coccidioides immitis RS]|uniref:Uncharacterized protein n=1 Tax=Coccidioides immitis (strain RS) TaxID=246410 RepID=J3KAZ6_COCIM|nr:uncharacterized protein CIMG_03269 [Coccidioides immitis RS]EAS32245.3 hypothetical protein CIMG_03269 [Coccidioides immitis RS]